MTTALSFSTTGTLVAVSVGRGVDVLVGEGVSVGKRVAVSVGTGVEVSTGVRGSVETTTGVADCGAHAETSRHINNTKKADLDMRRL